MTLIDSKVGELSAATKDPIRRFRVENHIMVEILTEPMYWTVTLFINRPKEGPAKRNIRAKNFITAPDAEGLVFELDNPISENTCSMERWKEMPNIDSFVKQVLTAGLERLDDKKQAKTAGPGFG